MKKEEEEHILDGRKGEMNEIRKYAVIRKWVENRGNILISSNENVCLFMQMHQ